GGYWMRAPHARFGFKKFHGGMAEYMIVPSLARAHRISKEIAPQHAAYAEPLSCALHAVERAEILFDDVVVIAGAGPIGLGATIGAAHKSPKLRVVLGFDDDKPALAEQRGADVTPNPSPPDLHQERPGRPRRRGQVDVQQEIRDLTGGYGADVYIECTGPPSAGPPGLNLLRKLGRFVEYSVFKENVSVDWSIISDDKELDVRGAHLGPHTWP